MTLDRFKERVHDQHRKEKRWQLFMCFGVMLMVIFLLGKILIVSPGFWEKHALIGVLLLLIPSWVLYKFPHQFKVLLIDSALPMKQKNEIVNKIIKKCNPSEKERNQQYSYILAYDTFWNYGYDLHLFYNESCFAFVLKNRTFGSGFLDMFGAARRRKKLVNQIRELANC